MYISGSKFRREEGFERSQKGVALLTDSQTEIPNKNSFTHPVLTREESETVLSVCCFFCHGCFSFCFQCQLCHSVSLPWSSGHPYKFSVDNECSDFGFLLASLQLQVFFIFAAPWYSNATTVNSRRVGCSRLVGRCSGSWLDVLVLDELFSFLISFSDSWLVVLVVQMSCSGCGILLVPALLWQASLIDPSLSTFENICSAPTTSSSGAAPPRLLSRGKWAPIPSSVDNRTFPRETSVDAALLSDTETAPTQSYLQRIYALLILRLFLCKILL